MTRLFPTTKNVGLNTEYYPNGNKMLEDTYIRRSRDDVLILEGLSTYWYDNGNKKLQGSYKNNLRDGIWILWDENGVIKYTQTYKDGGIYDGPWKEYEVSYSNVRYIVKKGFYKEGKKHNKWVYWYKGTKQKKSEGSYSYGLRVGLWKGWYESGEKKYKGVYDNGLLIVYDIYGDTTFKKHYKNNKLNGYGRIIYDD